MAIRGAERAAGWPERASTDRPQAPQSRVINLLDDDAPAATPVAQPAPPREVSPRDLDVLRTRLELLHDMADGDRKARDAYRISVQADLADMARQVHDVQRDHRGIRQTLGDLAAMVNRSTADVSATLAQIDELRTMILEVRDEHRGALGTTQRDTRRSLDQLEAHARLDRDWIGATQANVQLLADDLARQNRDAAALSKAVARADAELIRQQASELEHVATLREQLAEAREAIESLGEAVKRQAGQITKLRADLKKTASPAARPPAKKAAAKS